MVSNVAKTSGELLRSIEKGEPTEMVKNLLQDLASKIRIEPNASVSGLDLINQVIAEPGILWQKNFFLNLNSQPNE